MIGEQTGSEGGSFASEFEKYVNERLGDLKPGKIITGKIVAVNRDMATVDVGFKSFGIVPVAQFADVDGNVNVVVGEDVEVCIMSLENESSQVVLSRERAVQKKVWTQVEEVFKVDGLIRGRIVQKVKGGLQVDIGIPAFLPGSQIDIRPHRNLDKFLGETHDFKVLKVTKEKGNIVLSRRAVLLSERNQLRAETLKVLAEGVVMEGTVKNVTDYGAFIDLGGIDGLLHITDISWGRVNHPADKLSVGQVVPVVVLKYDEEKQRVSLGMKQLKPDPWVNVHERFPVGGKIKGKVVKITDFGAYIELDEGIEGLVHVSDISWTKKVRNPGKYLNEAEEIEAVVLGIDSEKQQINLGLKQLTPNPWHTLHERHAIGSHVKGKVRTIMDFGIFVGVEDGIDGLVHVSDFSWTKKIQDAEEIHALYNKGDEVEAVVLGIDIENERLSLGVKQLEADPWDTISQRYPVGSKVKGTVSSIASFGVFVQLEGGIEGLIHVSQLGIEKDKNPAEVFQPGTVVETKVINIDREERRISLSVKELQARDEDSSVPQFDDDRGIGVNFGDLIRDKLSGGK